MYAALVWESALGIRTHARAASTSLFRLSVLRVASGFRTVISGITPSDVMAMELKRICDRVGIG